MVEEFQITVWLNGGLKNRNDNKNAAEATLLNMVVVRKNAWDQIIITLTKGDLSIFFANFIWKWENTDLTTAILPTVVLPMTIAYYINSPTAILPTMLICLLRQRTSL